MIAKPQSAPDWKSLPVSVPPDFDARQYKEDVDLIHSAVTAFLAVVARDDENPLDLSGLTWLADEAGKRISRLNAVGDYLRVAEIQMMDGAR
ncbi:MAG: hypothetical protein LC791_16195 [Acidobacteria bacterium]|nr:hypothetical protein [Acidobacteriota bacterium]